MSEDLPDWLGLADIALPVEQADGAPPTRPADPRQFKRLQRANLDWTVVEQAHEPFDFRSDRKLPVFRPPGEPRRRNEFDLLVLPPRVDWRERAHIATPLDQRRCNCCTAFATAAIMTDLATIRTGSARAPLSPGYLHWCVGGGDCLTALSPDALAAVASQRLVALLQPNDFPYDPTNCPTAAGVARLSGSRSLFNATDAAQALQAGPILAVMDLYDDFWSHYGGGIYRRKSQRYLNTHSIEIVGYDGEQRCWFAKNSEGATWGEGGFARIAFGECQIFTAGGHGGLALTLA